MAFNKETQEFKTGAQVNYGWNLTWEATGKFPIIAKRAFKKLADAQAYVDDPTQTACEGLILAVFNDVEKNNGIYLVQSVGTSTAAGVLVKAGSGTGSITAANYTAAKALATVDNIGQIIYVLNEETSTTEKVPGSETEFVVYSAGPYVVTGAGSVAKLGTTTASGDLAGDVETLKGTVGSLGSDLSKVDERVDDIEKDYLVKDVKAGETSIAKDGLVKVDTEVNVESTSLNPVTHKALAEKFKAVEQAISLLPRFDVQVVESLDSVETPSSTTIYLVPLTKADEENKNVYVEYIYISDKWEMLGEHKLDLTDYYTKTEADGKFATLANTYDKTTADNTFVKQETGKTLMPVDLPNMVNKSSERLITVENFIYGTGTEGESSYVHGLSNEVSDLAGDLSELEAKALTGITPIGFVTSVVNNNKATVGLTFGTFIGDSLGDDGAVVTETVDGVASVQKVYDFVQREVENAFAWVDVVEEEE